jgi:hypothetical protein
MGEMAELYDEEYGPDEDHVFQYERFLQETPKAWLLFVQGKMRWFPKAVSNLNREKRLVRIPEWLAAEAGLEMTE